MIRLLSADLARLLRSPVFWLGAAAMFAYGVKNVLDHHSAGAGLESAVPDFIILLVFVQSVVSVVFIHDDHRYGGIRSKLTVGRGRAAVYMSQLAVQYLAALLYSALYLLAAFGVGLPLMGVPETAAGELVRRLFCAMWVVLAVTALLSALALLVPHRGVLAAGILSVLLLTIACSWMDGRLSEPEFIDDYGGVIFITGEDGSVSKSYVDWEGSVIEPEDIRRAPNPYYVREPLRGLCALCLDLSPTGQAIQLAGAAGRQSPLWVLGVSAAGVAMLVTVGGMLRFWRMDIK